VVVGGAPALLPVAAAGVFAEACWEPLPSSDLADSDLVASDFAVSDLVVSDLAASGLVEEEVDSDDVLDVVADVDDVEDVPPVALPPPVVALLVRELSVVVKELSRELITETLLLLIRVVPSVGTVVTGT
jgi:hypothetical protein